MIPRRSCISGIHPDGNKGSMRSGCIRVRVARVGHRGYSGECRRAGVAWAERI